MIGSMIIFVLLIIFYILIADIITIFFRLTGMTEESQISGDIPVDQFRFYHPGK